MYHPINLPTESNYLPPENTSRIINAYVEGLGEEGKYPTAIYGADGLKRFADFGFNGRVRGAISVGVDAYVLAGTKLLRVSQAGTSETIDGIPGAEDVRMARNSKSPYPQIAIVAASGNYILENNVLTRIVNVNLPQAIDVVAVGSFFVFILKDGRLIWTNPNEGTVIDAGDFATAEYYNGNKNIGAEVNEDDIWVFGEIGSEVWRLTGDATGLFTRFRPVNKGCIAKHSIQQVADTVMWVGDDKVVYKAQGYQEVPVSNAMVNKFLANEPSPENLTSFSYERDGRSFYVLHGTDFSVILDLKTGKWSERKSTGIKRWRTEKAISFAGRNICGDHEIGRLYEIDQKTLDEDGSAIHTEIILPSVHDFPHSLIFFELFVDMEVGVGLNTTDAEDKDPQLYLSWSDNGGQTWSSEISRPVGKLSMSKTTVSFQGLGMSRERIFKLRMSANVVKKFLKLKARVERTTA